MDFLRNLFRREPRADAPSSKGFIEVQNKWGIGNGTSLLVERHPNLESIFSNPNPQPPQRLTERNRSYWENESRESIRNALAMAYLSYPNPQVRADTIRMVKNIDTVGISQMLVDLLADSSSAVRSAAAEAIWDRERDVNCEDAVAILQDEIRGSGFVSTLGPTKAK